MKERALKRKNRPTRTLDLEVDPEDHVTYLVYPTEENAQVCVCVFVCLRERKIIHGYNADRLRVFVCL